MEEFLDREGVRQVVQGVKDYVDQQDTVVEQHIDRVERELGTKVNQGQIATREVPGLVRVFEYQGDFHIWTLNPDELNYTVTSNPAGGETYDIRTLNYRIEPNAAGGETYIFGEGGPGPGPGPVEDTYYAMGSFNEWQGTGYPMSETDIEYIRGQDADIAQAIENIEGGYENIYYIDGITLGDFDAGWTQTFGYNNQKYEANGSLLFDFCLNVNYPDSRWIPSPGNIDNSAALYNLSSNTLWTSPYQPMPNQWGDDWSRPPICIGGAGVYTLVLVKAVEDTNIPGYDPIPTYYAGLIKTEDIESEWGNIEPYVSPAISNIGLIGSMTDWNYDIYFTENTPTNYSLSVNLNAGDEFQIRANSRWDASTGMDGFIHYNWENFPAGRYIVKTDNFSIIQSCSVTITIDMPTADEDGFLHSTITFTYNDSPGPGPEPEKEYFVSTPGLHGQKLALTETDIIDILSRDGNLAQAITNISGGYSNIYYVDGLTLGDFDAGLSQQFGFNGRLCEGNGSLMFQFAYGTIAENDYVIPYPAGTVMMDGSALYSLDTAQVWVPPYQQTPDQWGDNWNKAPMITGGAGEYTFVLVKANDDTVVSGYAVPSYYVGVIKTQSIQSEWGNITPVLTPKRLYVSGSSINNWNQVYAYLWDNQGNILESYPGSRMADIGNGVYMLEYSSEYEFNNVLFNNNSDGRYELVIPTGMDYYNTDTNTWSVYSAN